MMKVPLLVHAFFGATLLNYATSFGGGEEKFIKKYAMMKVYESCFGSHILKEIRKEMKDASLKCSGSQFSFDDKHFNKEENDIKRVPSKDWLQEQPYKVKPSLGSKVKKPIHTTDTLLLQQWTEEQKQSNADDSASGDKAESETESAALVESGFGPSSSKPIDFSKLEEAIMSIGKPVSSFGVQKQGSANGNFQQSAAVGYYPAVYYPPPVPFAPSYPYHPYYSGYFPTPGPAGSAAFQSFYRSGHRLSKIMNFNTRVQRQFDSRPRVESVAFQYSTKIRNITCIMQELGYLDSRLNPNYLRMNERINKLDIEEELKKDMLDGIKFCREFSECVPETKRDSFQLSRELLRPMFFFRCYKHKKLESCIMKDIRERFSETNPELSNHVHRSFQNNDLASTIFDTIFEADSDNSDLFF